MTKETIKKFIAIYFTIGLFISFVQNLIGLISGNLTCFVWSGSLRNQILLIFWWLIVPALMWPYDLFWAIYHKFF